MTQDVGETISNKTTLPDRPEAARLIMSVRGQRVILDCDLARIYQVQTRVLNQAVKRNSDRFPPEFMWELTRQEIQRISQAVISLRMLRFSKQVHAFTEHGALMAATVLNSPRAVTMSLFIIRAFVKLREKESGDAAILRRLAEIDRSLMVHDTALRDIYRKLLPLLRPAPSGTKKEIGFHTLKD